MSNSSHIYSEEVIQNEIYYSVFKNWFSVSLAIFLIASPLLITFFQDGSSKYFSLLIFSIMLILSLFNLLTRAIIYNNRVLLLLTSKNLIYKKFRSKDVIIPINKIQRVYISEQSLVKFFGFVVFKLKKLHINTYSNLEVENALTFYNNVDINNNIWIDVTEFALDESDVLNMILAHLNKYKIM